jgi:transcriptional regulator of NAD metabolism
VRELGLQHQTTPSRCARGGARLRDVENVIVRDGTRLRDIENVIVRDGTRLRDVENVIVSARGKQMALAETELRRPPRTALARPKICVRRLAMQQLAPAQVGA